MRKFVLGIAAAFLAASGAWADSVKWEVTVPEGTQGEVWVSGSTPMLGNWNGKGLQLQRRADGIYTGEVPGKAGERFEYKFTQGSWATVEKTPNGAEKPNRLATVAAGDTVLKVKVERWAVAGEAPATRPSTIDGRVDTFEIESTLLKNKRKVWVWLPPEYDPKVAYPVLYMADGRNLFDEATSSFGREWAMDEAASALVSEGAIRPLIIVGIDHSDRRTAEFMSKELGYGKTYGKFVITEIKPLIDQQYKTLKGPENTFCGGASLGGLVSLAMLMDYPETFGGALAVSPSLWAEDQMIAKRAEVGGIPRKAKLWLDMGTAEGDNHLANTRRLNDALTKAGINVKYEEAPGAEHNETAWAARAPAMLKFLFAK